ncbi:hypothetical protein FRX31_016107 [Thalictrum thalictroides]|uniref:Uncharacterized protein n=1 Tax=Thalictrum thalictroides TaxID=46969 RepID=A0A7J6WD51_THATH|nr:hypothetical protein FRX31_016107 [Thalictrum thalictroides]
MMIGVKVRSKLVTELWNATVINLLVHIRKQNLRGISIAGLLAPGMYYVCQKLQLLKALNVKGRHMHAQSMKMVS